MTDTEMADLELVAPANVMAMVRNMVDFRAAVLAAAKAMKEPVSLMNMPDYLKAFMSLAEAIAKIMRPNIGAEET